MRALERFSPAYTRMNFRTMHLLPAAAECDTESIFGTLSTAQLDALESLHLTAIDQLIRIRVLQVRVLEREKIEQVVRRVAKELEPVDKYG